MRANRKSSKKYLSLKQARENKLQLDWSDYQPVKPTFTGTRVFEDDDLKELSAYIDWTPFFSSWQLAGKFPAILEDEIVGKEATKLYEDAQKMLQQIIDEKWLTAKAVIGIYPANTVNSDSIEIYESNIRDSVKTTFHHLRQQVKKAPGQPNLALTDFLAPKETGVEDFLGMFAVTAGIGIEPHIKRFEANHDDYNAILLKALADRLAEAFAERMHERVRKEFWAYDKNENLDNNALIKESYQGIRPAPGYPACPEHTEKRNLWALMNVEEKTGIKLTESCAMYPAAAVSGWYFANPKSKYMRVGQISKDQIEDYAKRKGMSVEEVEKWLGSILNYDV
jgi:5-methyltetrahydrofolate--homocysteine methyltransferase